MFFPECFLGDQTRLHFIGFKGEATKNQRDKIVNAVYEIKPLPEDTKAGGDQMMHKSVFLTSVGDSYECKPTEAQRFKT